MRYTRLINYAARTYRGTLQVLSECLMNNKLPVNCKKAYVLAAQLNNLLAQAHP